MFVFIETMLLIFGGYLGMLCIRDGDAKFAFVDGMTVGVCLAALLSHLFR